MSFFRAITRDAINSLKNNKTVDKEYINDGIDGKTEFFMDYTLDLSEIEFCKNSKRKEYFFNMSYRNIYNHWFHQSFHICFIFSGKTLSIQVSIGDQIEGKVDTKAISYKF